jgi:hypothetical protein
MLCPIERCQRLSDKGGTYLEELSTGMGMFCSHATASLRGRCMQGLIVPTEAS